MQFSAACQPAPVTRSSSRPGFWRARLVPLAILCGAVPILTVAAWLEPDERGVGTHQQLGLPACGFYERLHMPCATCGYTTAFAYAAHGRLVRAFIIQPAAAILVLVMAAMTIVCGYAAVVGISLAPLGAWFWRMELVWVAGGVVLGAWGYKILVVRGSF